MQLLWRDWVLCQSGDFISLANPRPSLRLIEFLMIAGIPQGSLLILQEKNGLPLSIEIEKLKIKTRVVNPRKGRAKNRLFFGASGLSIHHANAATLSILGFHWQMLVLGSILISRGEI